MTETFSCGIIILALSIINEYNNNLIKYLPLEGAEGAADQSLELQVHSMSRAEIVTIKLVIIVTQLRNRPNCFSCDSF